MTRVLLNETIVITLNGSGNGAAKLGPLTARETWYPESVSVKVNSNPTLESQCIIYVGDTPTQDNFRDTTFTGSSGDSSDKVKGRMRNGLYVHAAWSGGDANQQAVLTVVGEKEV